MSSVTRCKFKCNSVTTHAGGARTVEMAPVYSSDPNSENKSFWDASPGGEFKLHWINPKVSFEAGKEYYLDITEAPVQGA